MSTAVLYLAERGSNTVSSCEQTWVLEAPLKTYVWQARAYKGAGRAARMSAGIEQGRRLCLEAVRATSWRPSTGDADCPSRAQQPLLRPPYAQGRAWQGPTARVRSKEPSPRPMCSHAKGPRNRSSRNTMGTQSSPSRLIAEESTSIWKRCDRVVCTTPRGLADPSGCEQPRGHLASRDCSNPHGLVGEHSRNRSR